MAARTTKQASIERIYQRAMNFRDSTWQSINFEPIEDEYRRQYMRAFRKTHNVVAFRQQTKEYRLLLKAYRERLTEARNGQHGVRLK